MEYLDFRNLVTEACNKMSGLGFIATSRNQIMVRVDSGKIYKVNI